MKTNNSPIDQVSQACIDCKICLKHCTFLETYGTPGEICDRFLHGQLHGKTDIAYHCNLCGLCTVVCPLQLEISAAFLAMRRQLVKSARKDLSHHRGLLFYERAGMSRLLALEIIPAGCDTVFFPGCSLGATRPETTAKVFHYLKELVPNLGIVLNCCSRPSHDLGLETLFAKRHRKLMAHLLQKGVRRILTACPSCHTTFQDADPSFEAQMIYELLAETPPSRKPLRFKEASLHDACVTRREENIHTAVRRLAEHCGIRLHPLAHERRNTLCCSEGGGASLTAPGISRQWIEKRKDEAGGRMLITYCAGCSSAFAGSLPNIHLLDLLFDDNDSNTGAPGGTLRRYLDRIILKMRLSKA